MNAEKRNTGRIIAIIAGVLVVLCLCVICVVGIAYWQFGDQIAGLLGLAPQTQATRMMPADTPIYMSLSLNLQNQAGYQNLKELYLDNPDVQDALDQLMADFEQDTSINFKEDIQPWLGTEAALAFPRITDLDDFDTADILLTASTRDVEASEAFIQKLRDQGAEDGKPFQEGEHQGVFYWFQETESEFDTPVYAAIFDDFVVMTNSEETLFGAIDRSKSKGDSLADDENYQAVMDALPSNGAFFTYIDWGTMADVALKEAPVELEPEQLSQLEALEGIGIAATLQPDGLQIDTAIRFDLEKLPESARAAFNRPGTPNQILNRIPANAIGFFNTYDLGSIWEQTRENLAASPDFEQQLADLEEETGLNLDEDIFSWMTGESTLVVTEAQPADEFAPPLGGYLLIGTDDVELAQQKVDKLAELLSQEMFIEFESRTVGGQEMQVITDPVSQEIMGGYGFWEDFFVAGYLEDALVSAFAASDDPIVNSTSFKAVTDRLPDENYGYFYVNIDAIQRLVEAEMPEFDREDYENEVRPFIDPIKALGMASGPVEDDVQTVTLFLLVTENR